MMTLAVLRHNQSLHAIRLRRTGEFHSLDMDVHYFALFEQPICELDGLLVCDP